MEKGRMKPLYWSMLVILLVTLACGTSTVTQTTAPVIGDQVITQAPIQPTLEPTVSTNPFYRDEFDGGLDNWTRFTFSNADSGEIADKTSVFTQDGGLTFDINLKSTYIYLINNSFEYDDVQIETESESLGHNTNYISLVCRYDPDLGWYEFNIAASGLVSILRFDNHSNKYVVIGEGGSEAIHQGTDTNDFIAKCKGDRLTLTINGKEWRSFTDKNLKRGLIGVSAGSEEVIPVKIVFNWMDITEP